LGASRRPGGAGILGRVVREVRRARPVVIDQEDLRVAGAGRREEQLKHWVRGARRPLRRPRQGERAGREKPSEAGESWSTHHTLLLRPGTTLVATRHHQGTL